MMRKVSTAVLLSALLAAAVSSEAGPFKYESRGKRDPLVPLVGKEIPGAGIIAISEVASIDDIVLEGIAAQASGGAVAIINGNLVKEGFASGDVKIKKITKNSVLLNIGGKEYTIRLPEEGGQKIEQ